MVASRVGIVITIIFLGTNTTSRWTQAVVKIFCEPIRYYRMMVSKVAKVQITRV